jgi:hypothetical protein
MVVTPARGDLVMVCRSEVVMTFGEIGEANEGAICVNAGTEAEVTADIGEGELAAMVETMEAPVIDDRESRPLVDPRDIPAGRIECWKRGMSIG